MTETTESKGTASSKIAKENKHHLPECSEYKQMAGSNTYKALLITIIFNIARNKLYDITYW